MKLRILTSLALLLSPLLAQALPVSSRASCDSLFESATPLFDVNAPERIDLVSIYIPIRQGHHIHSVLVTARAMIKREGAGLMSQAMIQLWVDRAVERAAKEQRALMPSHLMTMFETMVRKHEVPGLTLKTWTELEKTINAYTIIPGYKQDIEYALVYRGYEPKVLNTIGGIPVLARYARTRQGSDDLKALHEAAVFGLTRMGYDDAGIRDVFLSAELGDDVIRAYHHARGH